MFFGGSWYKDAKREHAILQEKLMQLVCERTTLQQQLSDSNHTIFDSDMEREQFAKAKKKSLTQNECKLQVLFNAMRELGYDMNGAGGSGDICHLQHTIDRNDSDVSSASNRNVIDLTAAATHTASASVPLSLTTTAATGAAMNHSQPHPIIMHMEQPQPQRPQQQQQQQPAHTYDAEINDAVRVYPYQTQQCVSSYLYRNKAALIEELTKKYESAMCTLSERKRRRSRTPMERRIYHIDPDLDTTQLAQRNDAHQQREHASQLSAERYWVNTIDEALQSYVDGDVLELSEGRHVMSGSYPICGTLTVRGVAKSNWKTLIENECQSAHFIWCIGKDSRINLENVLIRQCGSHAGIVRLSLRAQFTAKNVIFHCNGLEGFYLEHESKLWLDHCVVLNSVGAAVHINTGCKCLLTCSNIVHCGECDEHVLSGQGAIVIYGTDVNYAEHLVRQTPSLRFPSMDNVPHMVLSPDPTLASMLRGRTYLYVQECKIKSNYGFGISFEVTAAFHGLPVPCIASMMDVSITVRETHFNDNVFGNMGKIPAHWIRHQQGQQQQLFAQIRKINPAIFHREGGETDHLYAAETTEAAQATEADADAEVVMVQAAADDAADDDDLHIEAEEAEEEMTDVVDVVDLSQSHEGDEGRSEDADNNNDEDDDVLIVDVVNAPSSRETLSCMQTMDAEAAALAMIERQGLANFEDAVSISSATFDSDRSSILAATTGSKIKRTRLQTHVHARCHSEPPVSHNRMLFQHCKYAQSSCPVAMDRTITQLDEFRLARLLQRQQTRQAQAQAQAQQQPTMMMTTNRVTSSSEKEIPNPTTQSLITEEARADHDVYVANNIGKQEMDTDEVEPPQVQSPQRSATQPCMASLVVDVTPPSPLRRSPRIRNKLQQQMQMQMQVQTHTQSTMHHNTHQQQNSLKKTKRAVARTTAETSNTAPKVSKKRKRVARPSNANKQCKQRETDAATSNSKNQDTPGSKASDKENESDQRDLEHVFVENTAITLPVAKRRKLSSRMSTESMVFPAHPAQSQQHSTQSQDIEVNAPVEHIMTEAPVLRRSTRKASIKASQALMAKSHRNANKKKEVLSQPSTDDNDKKPKSKRRARPRRKSAAN